VIFALPAGIYFSFLKWAYFSVDKSIPPPFQIFINETQSWFSIISQVDDIFASGAE
jgi:hypothetical protein